MFNIITNLFLLRKNTELVLRQATFGIEFHAIVFFFYGTAFVGDFEYRIERK
jgi:hypothetical protein